MAVSDVRWVLILSGKNGAICESITSRMGRGTAKIKDGKVNSLAVQIAGQSVIKSQMGRMGMSLPGPDSQLHEGAWDAPNFNLPNLRVRSCRTEKLAPVSSWRAVGAGPNVFICETLLDETIHAAGADPLEERIRLMGTPFVPALGNAIFAESGKRIREMPFNQHIGFV